MPKRMAGAMAAMLCAALLLASCGGGQRDAGSDPSNGASGGDGDGRQPVRAFEKAHVISKQSGKWLITEYVETGANASVRAISFTVSEDTELTDREGNAVRPDDIAIGSQVEVWHDGVVAESYPEQARAVKIVLLDGALEQGDGMIGRAQAAGAALESALASEPAGIWAVKDARFNEELAYWTLNLASHSAPDEPMEVRVDGLSGKVFPVPAAENEAFRVFTPAPDTVLGNSFTVEGQARVFEAAFTWQLEDGHHILAEGHAMADEGAPAWGNFKLDIHFEKATQPHMMLLLYVHSAKDGSIEHQLVVPLKVREDLMDTTLTAP
jgi:Immunoglobulin-like domain of bacterial spore germination.